MIDAATLPELEPIGAADTARVVAKVAPTAGRDTIKRRPAVMRKLTCSLTLAALNSRVSVSVLGDTTMTPGPLPSVLGPRSVQPEPRRGSPLKAR